MNDSEFVIFAKTLAIQAGSIMIRDFSLNMKKDWKPDTSPLTKTDLEINRLAIDTIRNKYPKHNILGEEESSLQNDTEYLWVCDPIDGTLPFSHGLPISTFSIALVINGECVVGVVYDPFTKRLFSAEKGMGAYMNGAIISVSKKEELEKTVGQSSFNPNLKYNTAKLFEYLAMTEKVKMLQLSSSIISSMMVAIGEFSFCIMPHHTTHDAAAAKIIVEEAGGRTSDLFGSKQRYDAPINGFIASNGLVHSRLIELTKKYCSQN